MKGADFDSPSYPGKRAFDIVVASLGLALMSPVMMLVALAVFVSSGRPVIYRGARVGLGGRPFMILKFRTMRAKSEGQLTTAYADPRITAIGRTLRRYKVDELPQFVNVLRGEMSLVGPRPEFQHWVDRYSAEQRKLILSVRPGITDLASVEFFDLASVVGETDADDVYEARVFARKNALRCEYVREMGWRTDLRILARTVKLGLTR